MCSRSPVSEPYCCSLSLSQAHCRQMGRLVMEWREQRSRHTSLRSMFVWQKPWQIHTRCTQQIALKKLPIPSRVSFQGYLIKIYCHQTSQTGDDVLLHNSTISLEIFSGILAPVIYQYVFTCIILILLYLLGLCLDLEVCPIADHNWGKRLT